MSRTTAQRQQGSTLVIVLMTGLAVSMVLASYLSLIASRHKVTVRSQCWNAAIPVLEAGVEEALAHLHHDVGQPAANSWTPGTVGGQPVYTKTRSFVDGSYYYVTLYNANSNTPTIYSTGYVPSPLQSGQYISRTVKVTATNAFTLFTKAIASLGTVSLGNGSVVDAYDSRVGAYDPTTNRFAAGGIATDSTASPAVTLGGHVYGSVITGPGGTIAVGSGTVGDAAWNASHTGVEPGWTNNNMNVAFPSNSLPSGAALFGSPTTITGGGSNITYLGNGSYQLASFSSSGSKQPMVVGGNATLWVRGDFKLSGNGYVYIAPGASLTLYVGGNTSLNGNGFVNEAGVASSLSYIGLSSNTSISFSGNGAFIGTIYAPQADVSLGANSVVWGAVICKSFSGGTFHYDKALAAGNILVATGWTEL